MFFVTGLSPQDISLTDVEDDVDNSTDIGLNNSDINGTSSNDTVVAIQSGPVSAKEGSNITISWAVKNDANSTITNVKGIDQNFDYDFGSLAPGESKSINHSLYIPTMNDLISAGFDVNGNGMDEDGMDEFFIGGFALSYSMNGKDYSINSNSITVILN